jgi:imidazolonepropionase-like amidohydrolase
VIAFRNATVLDGTGAAPFEADVLVEGKRIAAIDPPGQLTIPLGITQIDCAGATLMPGLIEPHAHLSFIDHTTPQALSELPVEEHLIATLRHAKLYLDHGFTACFSPGSTWRCAMQSAPGISPGRACWPRAYSSP